VILRLVLASLAIVAYAAAPAAAQDEVKPIGPFAVDVRVTMPRFSDDAGLADSRGLSAADLPGAGIGLDVAAHVYIARLGPATLGLGVQGTVGRSHASAGVDPLTLATTRAVTETFTSLVPQISFNFGGGDGWSYLSGGVGVSTLWITPDDAETLPADNERLVTVNYGGGARWFVGKHVAFTFDVRFYQLDSGTPALGFPGSPRTKFLILGAGISLRK